MQNNTQFKGLWPALFTPVGPGERPNYDQLNKLVEVLIAQNVDGLYVLGSTGQGVLFDESERKKVLEEVLSTVAGRVPVMVQVGALTTQNAVKLAEHAGQAGVDAISSVGPIYFGGGQDMAIYHYNEIAKAGGVPFFPYQLGNNSIPGSVADFIDKIRRVPHIAGMKLTTGNLLEISKIRSLSEGQLHLFSGADELMCQASLSGTVGAIGTFYNLWGAECKWVLERFKAGDFELGCRFMLRFQEIIDRVLPHIWTFLQEAMLQKHHIDIGQTVSPLGRGQKEWNKDEVAAILHSLDTVM
ncbi:dihydrodipicolinate synthase family protein [Sphingobacterium yanglingense]|uniref:N-acetylneuraminate lyase n=1 Tax=Sphingobacterium yanglingense TaxID=1437280 RepID=A0A4R6WGM7_9SPHI|nr:dihydrodipicolinate synthase family protein [Sphingobacterium yanglingense]TDQ79313.1 N-acetylneuraminate lyase [Sphingobacterium yanglingense]